ncbi:MAG TPA: hypothetical protein VH206_17480 [Xanthobacteraceae bacterium]|jgi:hypothetical protein|nr:hypothetical protein [Xanthobacteraceae bacterium]
MVALEGVMHVSAFATAISVAYVGLDRIHWDDEKFVSTLSDTEKAFADILNRFDLKPGIKYSRKSFTHMPVTPRLALFAVCHVAHIDVKMGWLRPIHIVHRSFHVPFFRYFRNRTDRKVITALAVFALIAFVYVTSLDTWAMEYFPFPACKAPHPLYFFDACDVVISSQYLIPWLFFSSVLISLWVCVTGAASQRMQNVPPSCEKLLKEVTDWIDGLGSFVRREVDQLPSPLSPPPKPPAA